MEKTKNMLTQEQFVYWLQGFFEIENPKTIDEYKTRIIKDHLDLVFNKVTPNRQLIEEKVPQPTYCNSTTICGVGNDLDLGYEKLNTRFSGIVDEKKC